ILDNKSTPQRILLTASAVKALMVTRKKIKFPFVAKGAMNLNIITFKTSTNRHTDAIRKESYQYLYKKEGEHYQIVEGENTRNMVRHERNVMTLAAFRGSKRRFEKFDNVPLINLRDYRKRTKDMDKALRVETYSMKAENKNKIGTFGPEWFNKNKLYFKKLLISITAKNDASKMKQLYTRLQADYGKKYDGLVLNEFEKGTLYAIILNEAFRRMPTDPALRARTDRWLKKQKEIFKKYTAQYIKIWRADHKAEWDRIKKLDPTITPKRIAEVLSLTLPRDRKHMMEMLKSSKTISRDMKIMSYTQKLKGEALPSAYGASTPAAIGKRFFKLYGVTQLRLDALSGRKRAVAQLVLNLLSPLNREKLTYAKEKQNFLNSDLPLQLISLYDEKKGISPMIEVLGRDNFSRMAEIYSLARKKKTPALETLLEKPKYSKTFDDFRKMVLKVRAAQLAGKTSVEYNKFKFHMKTEVMAGPYLKCANGSMAIRQRFFITTKKSLSVPWTGAYAERNVLVKGAQRKRAAYLTLMVGLFYKPRKTPPPKEPPPPRIPPPGGGKTTPPSRIQAPTGGGGSAPAAGSRDVTPTDNSGSQL
ncbi:hypothetical protein ACFL10_02075, partial [Patescibacteria group bacterium]